MILLIMKNILIIGGAGYVGSILIPKLLKKNYQITCFDLMIYGEGFLPKNNNLKIIKGDLMNEIKKNLKHSKSG